MGRKYKYRRLLLLAAASLLFSAPLSADDVVTFSCPVDHHTRALPSDPANPWKYNLMDGNRGIMTDTAAADVLFERTSPSSYSARVTALKAAAEHAWLGMYYGLGRHSADRIAFSPAAVYSPLIAQHYRPKITAVSIVVNDLKAAAPRPADAPDLLLKIELKGFSGSSEIIRRTFTWGRDENLADAEFPKTFTAEFDPAEIEPVGVITWVFNNAIAGDSIEIDALSLRLEMPALPPAHEAFVTSLGMLLANYDPASTIVNDKAHDRAGDLENVTATAKLAKILALAIVGGFADAPRAKTEITKIADAFINTIPKGPAGKDRLLAHFTRNGGAEKAPGSEWASGDSAYALLDLLVALRIIGDPDDRLDDVLDLIRDINWPALKSDDGAFHHGYTAAGELIPYTWKGFGAETIGVLLAAYIGDRLTGSMGPPPTDNGSGFIIHAPYPIAPRQIDIYANNWLALRNAEIDKQIAWYDRPDHPDPFLAANGLYGLSAAETPDGRSYAAYGIGGKYAQPNYTDTSANNVVVAHYSAMTAPLRPEPALQMYSKLKALNLLTPLNNVESLSIHPRTCEIIHNPLKGSWNLALQAEGWALSIPEIKAALEDACRALPDLAQAWQVYFPDVPAGDLDTNGNVNLVDFANFGCQWCRLECGQCLWCEGADINNDDAVNFADAEILFENYLAAAPQ